MASVVYHPGGVENQIDENQYPAFRDHFAAAERRKMIEDDLTAGIVVPLLLASVVTVGVLLAILSVLITA